MKHRLAVLALAAGSLTALWLFTRRGDPPVQKEHTSATHAARDEVSRLPAKDLPRQVPPPRFAAQSSEATLPFRETGAVKRIAGRNGHPTTVFEQEPRDPKWAAAMEEAMKARISADATAQAGIPSLSLDAIECHTSSCRMRLSFEQKDWDTVVAKGRPTDDPASYFSLFAGYGKVQYRENVPPDKIRAPNGWKVENQGDKFSVSYIVAFGEKDIHPNNLEKYAEESRARFEQSRQQ